MPTKAELIADLEQARRENEALRGYLAAVYEELGRYHRRLAREYFLSQTEYKQGRCDAIGGALDIAAHYVELARTEKASTP